MCRFFSCIITRMGDILFTEKDSHEEIINRAKLDDTKINNRDFVRIECIPKENEWAYIVDEKDTLPKWYTKLEGFYKDEVKKLAGQVKPLRDEYNRQYQLLLDEYERQKQPLRDEYERQYQPLRDEYKRQTQLLCDEYERQKQPLRDEYIKELKAIEGYLEE